jgi:uncharacterized protein (TIGR03792 family)
VVIEWKRVRVRPDLIERYIEKDGEVWTAGLEREEGFLGKEVWRGEEEGDLMLVIRWRSRGDWEGIPRERLEELERRFRSELPAGHDITDEGAFQPV